MAAMINTAHLLDHSHAEAHGFNVDLLGGGNDDFFWGVAATQGRRAGMEDAHAVDLDIGTPHPVPAATVAAAAAGGEGGGGSTSAPQAGQASSAAVAPAAVAAAPPPPTALFGVFDGHAGGEAAAFCARHIVPVLRATPAYAAGDLEGALSEAYLRLDAMLSDPAHRHELACLWAGVRPGAQRAEAGTALMQSYGALSDNGDYLGAQAGCTACVAVVRGADLAVANVGDSRCVVCEAGGRAVSLTRDHKPAMRGEQERVLKAGLKVSKNRVQGPKSSLAMSRALGDAKYKDQKLPPEQQAVTPVPETTIYMIGGTATGGGPSSSRDPAAFLGQEAAGCARGPAAAAAGALELDFNPAAAASAMTSAGGAAEFMIIACDGLWDCMSREKAVSFSRPLLRSGMPPQQVALRMVQECLATDSPTPIAADNITVLIVLFEPVPASAVPPAAGGGTAGGTAGDRAQL